MSNGGMAFFSRDAFDLFAKVEREKEAE